MCNAILIIINRIIVIWILKLQLNILFLLFVILSNNCLNYSYVYVILLIIYIKLHSSKVIFVILL